GIDQWTDRIEKFLSVAEKIDYLSLNKEETIALLSQLALSKKRTADILLTPLKKSGVEVIPPLLESGLHVGGRMIPLRKAISTISHIGPTYFSLTDAMEGAYLFDGKALLYCPSVDVTSWGTAGAGDAFASTIVAQLIKGHGPERALSAATQNAASVVEYVDTQTGLLTSEQIDRLAKNNIPSNHVLLLGQQKYIG
ncbi:MAG: carbohydrate kinase family protein, partial [Porticoccus sp.]